MKIYKDFDEFVPWGNAIRVWDKITNIPNGLSDFERLLESITKGDNIWETQLNDLLIGEGDFFLAELGIE